MKEHIVIKKYILFEKLKTKLTETIGGSTIIRYYCDGVYKFPTNSFLPLDIEFYFVRVVNKYGINWFVGYFDGYNELCNDHRINPRDDLYQKLENQYQRIIKIKNIKTKIENYEDNNTNH